MKCLILASGQLNKFNNETQCKVNTDFMGLTLMERALRVAQVAGATQVFVLAATKDNMKAKISKIAYNLKLSVTTIEAELKTPKECIAAIVRAQNYFNEPFLFFSTMNIVDYSIIKKFVTKGIRDGEIAIAVDTKKDNDLIDPTTVNRAIIKGGRVQQYGRGVKESHGFDAGIYYFSPIIFKALRSAGQKGQFSIAAAIDLLVPNNRVKAINVGGSFWAMVQDKKTIKKAEEKFNKHFVNTDKDDMLGKIIHRPLSTQVAKLLVQIKLSAVQLRIITYLIAMCSGLFFFSGNFLLAMIGGILAIFFAVFDGIDKHIAALLYQESISPDELYDQIFERFADIFILIGLGWYVFTLTESVLGILLAVISIGGFVTQNQLSEKGFSNDLNTFVMGRGIYSVLIAVGTIFNLPEVSLLLIALHTCGLVGWHIYQSKQLQANSH